MDATVNFEKSNFKTRLKSMLKLDFRRMFKSRLFYILILSALIMPILITVMMSMMDGSVSVNPQTGEETVMEGPENTWQSIGSLTAADEAAMGGMDVMSMCNINMMYMLVAVFVGLFISDDFRSGYAKNLFTVRAGKGDYIISKTLAGFVCGTVMLLSYFIGAMLGGAMSGLSFELGTYNMGNLLMCMVAKICLMLVFVAIFVLVSVAAKKKAWLSICGSLAAGMLMFMMVPMITPLGSTPVNAILCLAGGTIFAIGFGAISNLVLKKTSLV